MFESFSLPVIAEICPLEYEPLSDVSMTDSDLSKEWERVPSGIPTYESSTMPLGVSAPPEYDSYAARALLSNAASSLAGWWRSYYSK